MRIPVGVGLVRVLRTMIAIVSDHDVLVEIVGVDSVVSALDELLVLDLGRLLGLKLTKAGGTPNGGLVSTSLEGRGERRNCLALECARESDGKASGSTNGVVLGSAQRDAGLVLNSIDRRSVLAVRGGVIGVLESVRRGTRLVLNFIGRRIMLAVREDVRIGSILRLEVVLGLLVTGGRGLSNRDRAGSVISSHEGRICDFQGSGNTEGSSGGPSIEESTIIGQDWLGMRGNDICGALSKRHGAREWAGALKTSHGRRLSIWREVRSSVNKPGISLVSVERSEPVVLMHSGHGSGVARNLVTHLDVGRERLATSSSASKSPLPLNSRELGVTNDSITGVDMSSWEDLGHLCRPVAVAGVFRHCNHRSDLLWLVLSMESRAAVGVWAN